jgi:hypothetical protein
MNEVLETESFSRATLTLEPMEQQWIDQIRNQLTARLDVGKPLRFDWFREKRFGVKRLYFVMNRATCKVLLVFFAHKKNQEKKKHPPRLDLSRTVFEPDSLTNSTNTPFFNIFEALRKKEVNVVRQFLRRWLFSGKQLGVNHQVDERASDYKPISGSSGGFTPCLRSSFPVSTQPGRVLRTATPARRAGFRRRSDRQRCR